MKVPGKKGIALIVVIIIILIAAIATLGISVFVSSSLSLNAARAAMETALFAAQAGVYAAIYDYLATPGQPYWDRASDVVIMNNVYYSSGGRGATRKAANFLLIDADNPQTVNSSGTNNMLQRIPLTNINQAQSITVNRMMVEWSNFGGNLNRIQLGGTTRWTGTAASGQLITLTSQFTMNAQQSFPAATANTWRFTVSIPSSGNNNAAIILVTFYFTDNSTRKAYLMNNGRSGNNEFSITATGEVKSAASSWKRTIDATYDAGVNRITSWQEIDTHL